MGDNKIDMPLDDIIKMNKKDNRKVVLNGRRRGAAVRGARGSRGARAGPAGRGARPGRASFGRTQTFVNRSTPGLRQQNLTRVANQLALKSVRSNINLGTKKIINNLVKKAVKRAMATTRTGTVARSGLAGRVGRQGVLAQRIVGRSPRAGVLLNRVGLTSRVIQKARPAQNVVIQRARAIRRPIQAPRYVEQIVQRPAPRAQLAQQQRVIVRRVIQQQQQPRQQQVVVRRRAVQQPRQIVVERQIPRVRQQMIRRPVQVVQRVAKPIRERVQYVQVQNRANNNFGGGRRAGGFGGRIQQRIVEVPRFESFRSARVITRRGRGFEDY